MKTPAVFLSFDDKYIEEWYGLRDFFTERNIKATFYVSPNYPEPLMTEKEWLMLMKLKADGHTIGYHGLNHLNAVDTVNAIGLEKYLQYEIYNGMQMFKDRGFDIHHFSYPYGAHDERIDRILLERFDTLRCITGNSRKVLLKEREVNDGRVFTALLAQPIQIHRAGEMFTYFERFVKRDAVLFTYMHNPNRKFMESLLPEQGLNYYPMEVLDR